MAEYLVARMGLCVIIRGGYYNEKAQKMIFVKHHGTRELFVTGCEQWNGKHPSKEILSELNSMADGCQLQYQITFHTHTDLPWAEELDHLKFESGDMLIWEDAK